MPEQHDPSQATASTAPSAAVESASEDPEPDPDASAVSIPSGARLVLATHNAGKLAELRAMIAAELPGLDVERAVVDAGSLGLPDVRETGQLGCDHCLLYTSPSPRDRTRSRMPSSA